MSYTDQIAGNFENIFFISSLIDSSVKLILKQINLDYVN